MLEASMEADKSLQSAILDLIVCILASIECEKLLKEPPVAGEIDVAGRRFLRVEAAS